MLVIAFCFLYKFMELMLRMGHAWTARRYVTKCGDVGEEKGGREHKCTIVIAWRQINKPELGLDVTRVP